MTLQLSERHVNTEERYLSNLDTQSQNNTALQIDTVGVTYTHRREYKHAVRDATLSVRAGESVALVGESGSGKTTIARSILGLLPRTAQVSGSISVKGQELGSLSAQQARYLRGRNIGYIPQDPGSSLDPIRRVIDSVIEPLNVHRIGKAHERKALALQALKDAGLANAPELAERWPHQLSGGQRQRVLIAAAIVTRPALIVADEPTSALDVTVQKVILDKLQEIIEDTGTAMLLITHDLSVAALRTDRTYAMKDGEIVEHGPSKRVLSEPEHPYTKELVAAIPGKKPFVHVRSLADKDPALLEARGLKKTFGSRGKEVLALNDVHISVRQGTSMGIVGESGSGKTTLARTLLGLEKPDAGDIRSLGNPARQRSREFLRLIQPVFQNPHTSFDPMRTIGWSILEPACGLKVQAWQGQLGELMESVGLDTDLAKRKPHELSGGQLQRAAIARALSVNPRVLVLDEAVSALDVTVQATILALLAKLRDERGLSFLFITHDLAVVRELCSEVIVMKSGHIVESGTVEQVWNAPQHHYTRALLAATS